MFISKLYSVNKHDCLLFKATLLCMLRVFAELNIQIPAGVIMNLDPGFDSKSNKKVCIDNNIIPNIKCNPRNSKKAAVAPDMETYAQRYVNERAFA